MKALIRMCQNWLARQRPLTQQRLEEEEAKRDRFFREHRAKPDPLLPSWSNSPDNPGVKGPSYNGIFDVAAPKTA